MKKDVENMRNRTIGINVRVNENEKKKLTRNAQKSGLNLSSYLRKVGLKQEIYSIPDKDFYKIYLEISNLKNEMSKLTDDEIKERLEQIKRHFLEIYNSKKVGDFDGDN